MVTVKLVGGLGNQIFQYAFGQAIAKTGVEITYDLSWYKDMINHNRPYLLEKFQTKVNKVYSKADFLTFSKEVNHLYNSAYLAGNLDNIYFFGYFQHLPYFQNILPQLQNELELKAEYYTESLIDQLIGIENDMSAISVHVRRGDYLLQKGWGVLPVSYYFKAINELEGNLHIFSDDIPYCQNIFKEAFFKNRKITFYSNKPYEDFMLMKHCQHHIVANSTFSYWAAISDKKANKIVICPDKWLGENESDLHGQHYPKEWRKIQC